MTAIERVTISAEKLKGLMNDKLHENEEFRDIFFLTPDKSGFRHRGYDENWGFPPGSILQYSSNIDEQFIKNVEKKATKIWDKFASEFDIE